MKGLVFGGIVVGALGYLWVSQSDAGQQWLNEQAPAVAQVSEQAQREVTSLMDHAKTAKDLIAAKAEINSLQQELALLKDKSEAVDRVGDGVAEGIAVGLAEGVVDSTHQDLTLDDSITQQLHAQLSADSQALDKTLVAPRQHDQYSNSDDGYSPNTTGPTLMSADERSEALFALMHRMELRAAGL